MYNRIRGKQSLPGLHSVRKVADKMQGYARLSKHIPVIGKVLGGLSSAIGGAIDDLDDLTGGQMIQRKSKRKS
jgi:hypothetical protein